MYSTFYWLVVSDLSESAELTMSQDLAHSPSRGRKRQRVNLRQVAELANVSPTTVSRVLNHSPIPSMETRASVLEAVASLNYMPRSVSRRQGSAAGGGRVETGMIGLLQPPKAQAESERGNVFYNEIVSGVQEELARHKRHLVLAVQDDQNVEIPLMVAQQRVDALLTSVKMPASLAKYVSEQLPVVFMGRSYPDLRADSVITDSYQGTWIALERLYELGHRHIVFFSVPDLEGKSRQRELAYADFMKSRGLEELVRHPLNQPQPLTPDNEIEVRAAYVKQLMECAPRPTAIIGMDRELGYIMQELQGRGVQVPADISLVSIYNRIWGDSRTEPLAGVRFNMNEVGATAVQLALQRLANPGLSPRRILIAGSFQEAASCNTPPSSGLDSTLAAHCIARSRARGR